MYIKYNLISCSSTLFMYICVVREDILLFFIRIIIYHNRDFFDEIPIFIVHLYIIVI